MAYDKLIITDFETGGLDPDYFSILEIGAICVDHASLDVLWEHEQKITPIGYVDPEAAAVNGYNEADWADAVSLREGFTAFHAKLDDTMLLTGNNVWFDLGFYLRTLRMLQMPDVLDPTPKYSYHRLDVASMGFPFFHPPIYRLKEMAAALGIPPEPLPHRAINGARLALQIIRRFRTRGDPRTYAIS